MKRIKRLNRYRALSIFIIVFITFGVSVLLGVNRFSGWNEWACLACLDFIFILIFVFKLEYDRRTGVFLNNTQTHFRRLAILYLICAVLTFGMRFLPEFSKPVMLIPLLICAVSDSAIAMTVGLFFDVLLALTCSANHFALITFVVLTLLGAVLADVLREKTYRLFLAVILFFINLIIPGIFCHWAYGEISLRSLCFDLANAIITALCAFFVFGKLWFSYSHEVDNQYLDIVTEDYPEVQRLKNYSMDEYRRAKKVSEIAYRCAKVSGCNATLCLAAGFYYRMGRWLGEPCNQNAKRQAEQLCFPSALTQIIAEYYGEDAKPSSPESALVHIVDSLVDKLEGFDSKKEDTPFSRDMLIYQTVNGFSATGIYDHSGMGMNQFLRVREYLAREELLQ